jgi:hypothetical protein
MSAAKPRASWPIEDALITLKIIEGLFESARNAGWSLIAA